MSINSFTWTVNTLTYQQNAATTGDAYYAYPGTLFALNSVSAPYTTTIMSAGT